MGHLSETRKPVLREVERLTQREASPHAYIKVVMVSEKGNVESITKTQIILIGDLVGDRPIYLAAMIQIRDASPLTTNGKESDL